MVKKISLCLVCVLAVVGVTICSGQPVFINYSNHFELYLNSSSSMAKIISVDYKNFYHYKNVCGESVEINVEFFELQDFLQDFNAKVLFAENIQDGVSYYVYSPKIKYQKIVNGKRVNLQLVQKKNYINAGAPLIFGSF